MEWSGEGIIIGTRKHGETSLIVELMTRDRGRHLGLVRGGRSRKQHAVLQPGNRIVVTWRARLDEHLGVYTAEAVELNAARLMIHATAVHGIQLLGELLRLLPERDPHPELFAALEVVLMHLDTPDVAGPLMVRFELQLLEELGFGLDLTRCAGSGRKDDLVYVSPKSGRAVNRETGEPWKDKLLPLPEFLNVGKERRCTKQDLINAFRLTTYFLNRDVWAARGQAEPVARAGFMAAVSRAMAD